MKKIIILIICLLLCGCQKKEIKTVDINSINTIDFSNGELINLDLYANEYLLVDLSNFEILYQKDIEFKMFPASLTKLMTLNTVLNCVDDLSKTSSYTNEQLQYLLDEDASLAGLQCDKEYTIEELLYGLILPSGADAAMCLENYFTSIGLDLVEQMNIRANELGLQSSHYVNTTGLHDEDHYSCVLDIYKIAMDTLKFEEGRRILETIKYDLDEEKQFTSTVAPVMTKGFEILGGKTGYTPESGRSILVLFRKNNRSYLMILANCKDEERKDFWHYIDTIEIFKSLY